MDRVVRVHFGGSVIETSEGSCKFEGMTVKSVVFVGRPSFEEVVGRVREILEFRKGQLNLKGRYDVGVGNVSHKQMLELNGQTECDTYVDIVMGSQFRSLDVVAETETRVDYTDGMLDLNHPAEIDQHSMYYETTYFREDVVDVKNVFDETLTRDKEGILGGGNGGEAAKETNRGEMAKDGNEGVMMEDGKGGEMVKDGNEEVMMEDGNGGRKVNDGNIGVITLDGNRREIMMDDDGGVMAKYSFEALMHEPIKKRSGCMRTIQKCGMDPELLGDVTPKKQVAEKEVVEVDLNVQKKSL